VGGRDWEVWTGDAAYRRVVSYAAPQPMTSWNFNVLDFINDVKAHSSLTDAWYLTSIQAGFEPWVGGTGLAVTSFNATVNGGGAPPQAAPQPSPTPTPTATVTPTPTAAPTQAPSQQPAPQSSASTPATTDAHTYVVRAGDTLWGIAKREHVKGGWRSLYQRNRGVVGPDPDLILPGQRLSL
jgi:hypothetical protein